MQQVPSLLAQHRLAVLVHELVHGHGRFLASLDVVGDQEHRAAERVVKPRSPAALLGAHGHGADQRLPVGLDLARGGHHHAAQATGQTAVGAHQLLYGRLHRLDSGGTRGPQDGGGQVRRHLARVPPVVSTVEVQPRLPAVCFASRVDVL